MSNQLFKNSIPSQLLFNLLDKICEKIDDQYYLFNKVSFKQGLYYNHISNFCSELKDYYYPSKQYYVTRTLNYNKFTTILRHICKVNKINFLSKIKYDKSDYDILYFIYF